MRSSNGEICASPSGGAFQAGAIAFMGLLRRLIQPRTPALDGAVRSDTARSVGAQGERDVRSSGATGVRVRWSAGGGMVKALVNSLTPFGQIVVLVLVLALSAALVIGYSYFLG